MASWNDFEQAEADLARRVRERFDAGRHIREVVITGLDPSATKLVVESWTPERGLRRVERD